MVVEEVEGLTHCGRPSIFLHKEGEREGGESLSKNKECKGMSRLMRVPNGCLKCENGKEIQ
jgi:hypothetical protein